MIVYICVSMIYMFITTIILLYGKERTLSTIHSIPDRIGKKVRALKSKKRYVVLTTILIIIPVFSYKAQQMAQQKGFSEITFDRIEEVYSSNSILVFCEERLLKKSVCKNFMLKG